MTSMLVKEFNIMRSWRPLQRDWLIDVSVSILPDKFRMGTRCFWDSGSDNSASETFMNVRHPSLIFYPLPFQYSLGWRVSDYIFICFIGPHILFGHCFRCIPVLVSFIALAVRQLQLFSVSVWSERSAINSGDSWKTIIGIRESLKPIS